MNSLWSRLNILSALSPKQSCRSVQNTIPQPTNTCENAPHLAEASMNPESSNQENIYTDVYTSSPISAISTVSPISPINDSRIPTSPSKCVIFVSISHEFWMYMHVNACIVDCLGCSVLMVTILIILTDGLF
ncbi:hypothetical protein MT418_8646 [Batrachochytrium dendrobatidis]